MRLRLGVLALVSTAFLLVSCMGSSGTATPTPTVEQSAPTGTAVPPSPSGTPGATPGGSSANNGLNPPTLWLAAKSGEQQASPGASLWVNDAGFAADIKSQGFDIHKQALAIERGEQVHLAFRDGPVSQTLELKVYPRDGNEQSRTAQDGKTATRFVPTTEPVASQEVSPSDLTWTADLEPGSYFVWLYATWPNKWKADMPMRAEYAFTVEIR